jgi:hypothetical protein
VGGIAGLPGGDPGRRCNLDKKVIELLTLLSISFLFSGIFIVLFIFPFASEHLTIENVPLLFVINGIGLFIFGLVYRKIIYKKIFLD